VHSGALASGTSYQVHRAIKLPRDIVGDYYVFVVTDPTRSGAARGAVYEGPFRSDGARVWRAQLEAE